MSTAKTIQELPTMSGQEAFLLIVLDISGQTSVQQADHNWAGRSSISSCKPCRQAQNEVCGSTKAEESG